MRSGIAGFLTGTALSAVTLAGVSVLGTLATDRPDQRAVATDQSTGDTPVAAEPEVTTNTKSGSPEAVAIDVPAGSAFDTAIEDEEAMLPQADGAKPASSVAQLESPVVDTATPETQTETAAQPEAASTGSTMTSPEIPQDSLNLGSSAGLAPQQDIVNQPESDALSAAPLPSSVPQTQQSVGQPSATEDAAEPSVAEDQPQPDAVVDTAEDTNSSTAGTIKDLAQGVTTNRLPAIGRDTGTVDVVLSEDGAIEREDSDLTPLERHAVPFENAENKPLVSIILIDEGPLALGPDALADFPHPVSFAIDVTRPDAAEVAARYRQAGHEVLAMTNLPENANPQDTEVAMATYLQAIPDAVAIIEGGISGLQSSRASSEQLGEILRDSGHGIIMLPKGLNTAQKLIARQGVPSLTVFRDIDGDGQDTRAIRRVLDQAVFKAGQSDEGVVMMGRLRPQTISAMVLWALQDRASSVALAPVSAVLTASDEGGNEESGNEEG